MRLPPLLHCLAAAVLLLGTARAANHREAPLTALDHKADITDFFAFVSYDDPSKVTLILDVDPLLEPANGPNYFPFDPEILYAIRIDSDHDAKEDTVLEFRFVSQQRLPDVFTGFVGAGAGITAPPNAPNDLNGNPMAGKLVVPPAITALAGSGSEGLGFRQRYTVRLKQRVGNTLTTTWTRSKDVNGKRLWAVPSNVGPRTIPDYESFAKLGIFDLGDGIKVFAGTVDDPFWIDLGAAFDSLNFRQPFTGGLGVLNAEQDGAAKNFAADDVSGYNVNAIAIQIPITLLTSDRQTHPAADPRAVIGTWGTTSRARAKRFAAEPGAPAKLSRAVVQIQRMGNPLFNELIIGTGSKDKFSMSEPKDDDQFKNFALDPLLARVLNAVTGAVLGADSALPIPAPPRLDLLPLVRYVAPVCSGCTTEDQKGPIADLLRLNTGISPTPPGQANRLGALAGDLGGFPNGRRLLDDVTDIAARAVVGVLAAPFDGYNPELHNRIGDGVNVNDVPYQPTFPYLAFAQSGRNSRHVDPGEEGCSPGDAAACPND